MAENTFYKCSKCGILFATFKAVAAHKCSHADDAPSISHTTTNSTLFTCEECNGWFTSKDEHDRHPCCNVQPSNATSSGSDLSDISRGIQVWDRAATLFLIDQYVKLSKHVEMGTMRKKQMFAKIAVSLREKGYQFNDEQVCGRWKTLVRGYKTVNDHNGKSGNDRKTHEYQNELDKVFENDPCLMPNVTISSKRPQAVLENELDQETGNLDDNQESSVSQTAPSPGPSGSETECTHSAKKRLRTKSSSAQVAEMLQNYIGEQKERHEQETKRKEAMHKDRLDVLKTLIDAIKGQGASSSS